MFMSGPLATLIAADLGADVIKIEAVQRLDGWRGVGRGGLRPWENSVIWNWINRNKRGITLNLADERGADLFRQLVGDSDVVIENYTPRVMRNFGLGYEQLRAIKDDLDHDLDARASAPRDPAPTTPPSRGRPSRCRRSRT